jgi:hypothetical protein
MDKMEFVSNYEAGKITRADAQRWGIKWRSIQRRYQRYKKSIDIPTPIHTVTSPLKKTNPTPPKDDLSQFYTRLHSVKDDYIRVMHPCDIHFPYPDDNALDLTVQLVEYTQPHVCVLGSDEFDFMRLGRFDVDMRITEDEIDEIEIVRPFHTRFVDRLIKASPNTIYVWIFGNHDYRLYKHILKQSPNLSTTITRAFTDMIRYQGRVLFAGEIDQVRIHNLIVSHGNRAGEHPAKKQLETGGYQVNYMSGHVHRRTFYRKAGYHYGVVGVTSGCLCQLHPHYKGINQDSSGWELGTAIAEIKAGDDKAMAHINNLHFDKFDEDRLCVRYEGVTFVSK